MSWGRDHAGKLGRALNRKNGPLEVEWLQLSHSKLVKLSSSTLYSIWCFFEYIWVPPLFLCALSLMCSQDFFTLSNLHVLPCQMIPRFLDSYRVRLTSLLIPFCSTKVNKHKLDKIISKRFVCTGRYSWTWSSATVRTLLFLIHYVSFCPG